MKFLNKKDVAHKIAELTGNECRYLGPPSFGFQIENIGIDGSGNLSGEYDDKLISELENAGFKPLNPLTVQIPKFQIDEHTLANLKQVAENKDRLFRTAFFGETTKIIETEDKIEFPWFYTDGSDVSPYCVFISLLCEFCKKRKRINAVKDNSENQKYAMRCFLIRIGMVGTEYKQTRKTLLKNLKGSSAFRNKA